MKTYLARLVARAQSAPPSISVPTRVTPSAIENPFESTAAIAPPSARPTAPATVSPVGSSLASDASFAAPTAPAPLLPVRAPSPASSTPPSPLVAPSLATTTTHAAFPTPSVISTPSTKSSAQKIFPPGSGATPIPTTPAIPDDFSVAPPASVLTKPGAASITATDGEKLSPPSDTPVPPSSSVSPVNEGDAQAQLLRAADLFMARFSKQAEALVSPSSSPASLPLPAAASTTPTAPPRLQPAAQPPAAPPPPPAPSVVIGRLNVEIVPPAAPAHPAPAASRGARRTVSRSLPTPRSSARFGLGQL